MAVGDGVWVVGSRRKAGGGGKFSSEEAGCTALLLLTAAAAVFVIEAVLRIGGGGLFDCTDARRSNVVLIVPLEYIAAQHNFNFQFQIHPQFVFIINL